MDVVVERLDNAYHDSKRETGFVGLRNQVRAPRDRPRAAVPLQKRASFLPGVSSLGLPLGRPVRVR